MTRLVLVRHGETQWHTSNRYAGRSDVALTARGLAQAERLADWAAGAGLTGLWCSPLSRARQTATACARASGLSARTDERLRELDFGKAEGLTVAEMAAWFPDRLAAFRADPVVGHLPGGEHPRDAARRFLECLDEIVAGDPDGRVLVVAHTTAIRLALCALLGVPLRQYRRLFPSVGNCTLTELRRGRAEGTDPQRSIDTALLRFNCPTEVPDRPSPGAPGQQPTEPGRGEAGR